MSKTIRLIAMIPIVFLHGFLGTGADWDGVCSFLPKCDCVKLDLPGHGQAPFTENFTIDVDYFHLVGYSMGGRIAMGYAAKHPKKVASLTLLSAHSGLSCESEKQQRLKDDAAWAQLLFELSIDEFLVRWYDQPLFDLFKPDLSMRRKQNIPGLAAMLMHYSLGKQPAYEPKDALVLVGERDKKYRALYPNAVIIPEAGHPIHLENPKAVAQEISKRIFL